MNWMFLVALLALPSQPLTITGVEAERSVHCGPRWTLTLTKDGGTQSVSDTCIRPRNEKHQIELQPGDWQRLIESVESSGFPRLPDRIEARSGDGKISVVADDDLLCISVKTRESVHRVCGEDHAIRATADGKRFLKVWERLVWIAPEPK